MFNSKFTALLFGIFSLSATSGFVNAKEGMYQPSKIKAQEAEMKRMGLKIPVEQLYNENGTGLNNAVVLFGGGCTGEFVSAQGLIFTNHHCAYSYGQSLSTKEQNYLENGFFAKNRAEELPCPGLTVQIVRKMEDVTAYVLYNISDTLAETERHKIINERIENLKKGYKRNNNVEVDIKPFYEGNEYWAIIKDIYKDVRMVAFPPDGIGKFGADTDNWMWPRQSGDFAVLRVYADANNNPAEYNPNNKPYKPIRFFPINISGVSEGDFTMVYGFPGRTTQYISSYQVNQIQNIIDPIRIDARTIKLNVWDKFMRNDKDISLKYASKQASVANGWKKWQGEVLGLQQNKVIALKESREQVFANAIGHSDNENDRILLTNLEANIKGSNQHIAATEYSREAILGIEAIQAAVYLNHIMGLFRTDASQATITDSLQKIKTRLAGFYKNYEPVVDQAVFEGLIPYYMSQNSQAIAPQMKYLYSVYDNNAEKWSRSVYNNSLITNKARMYDFLDNATQADSFAILGDPAYKIYDEVMTYIRKEVNPKLTVNNNHINVLNRQYMKAQMQYNPARKPLYPDANSTLRIAYGNVTPIAQKEGNFFLTTLDMKVARYNSAIEEFNIPTRLMELHQKKDYGRWQQNNTVPINFIATNHTTGGNSGSPVLNAKGELIGINFDRIWQGTMSDIHFDEGFCRNISVDVRYVLFIIEKYGQAGWLLKEMKLNK
jgi:hypothetical protein